MGDQIQSQTIQLSISREELKSMIREAVLEALADYMDDFDDEPNFAPHIAERLEQYKNEMPETISVDEVVKELGLDA